MAEDNKGVGMADDKQAVVQELREAFQEFRDATADLGEAQLTKPVFDQWSVREIAAHIIGWHEQMTTGFERMARGERPTPEGVNWSDIDGWNKTFVAESGETVATALIEELDGRVENLITAIQALPDDRFGEGKTANRMAAGAGYEHLHEHAEEIKQAREAGKLA
jgi:hypothetical protein